MTDLVIIDAILISFGSIVFSTLYLWTTRAKSDTDRMKLDKREKQKKRNNHPLGAVKTFRHFDENRGEISRIQFFSSNHFVSLIQSVAFPPRSSSFALSTLNSKITIVKDICVLLVALQYIQLVVCCTLFCRTGLGNIVFG